MPQTICLHDRATIAAFLQADAPQHMYAIGDLDDFFWPYTNWYALAEQEQIREIVLAYTGLPQQLVLHALTGGQTSEMEALLRSIMHLLPRRIYAHLSPGLVELFAADYRVEPHGLHDKMALTDRERLAAIDTSATVALGSADLAEIEAFYQSSYPGNWFDPRMLETGQFYGVREQGELISIAGIHVYSPAYSVAALGNITTHPKARGRGLATFATARLCKELLRSVEHIGLNVKSDNTAAIACYTKLGFTRVGTYEEFALELR